MKLLSRTLVSATILALLPIPASAQTASYDPAVYDMLLDCTALQVLFAQAADKEADKTTAANNAVGYLSAAQYLAGSDIKDLGAELKPRRERILAMLGKKDGSAERLVKTCSAVMKVGVNAAAAAAK